MQRCMVFPEFASAGTDQRNRTAEVRGSNPLSSTKGTRVIVRGKSARIVALCHSLATLGDRRGIGTGELVTFLASAERGGELV